ncbi:Pentatricopeptide repeat-containing protein [Frankliniella fusca]|uniref:Pentatricopeptide repeat-containing protein n=1 Tax=Frankliniella fusca TaxID=407009 RepID=A0AAE1LLE4_9NEOP|nr:Pentatricopeptide repeat-containing protein [Frankliniella fusca]
MNLGRVSRTVLPNEKRITAPANMPELPLGTKSALKEYESFLAKSDLNLAAVCDYMSSYVRTSVADPERKSANKIPSQLLRNSLAQEMNLEGGNGKIAFRSLKLYKVFQGTLQAAFPDSDLEVADDALRRWLKDAK